MEKLKLIFMVSIFLTVVFPYANAASSTLYYKYYSWWQVNASTNSQIVASLNTTGKVALMVLTPSQFQQFKSGYGYSTIYNRTVGTGLYTVDVSSGSYYVLIDAIYGQVNNEFYARTFPKGAGSIITINRAYSLPLSLKNYSNFNISIWSPYQVNMNISQHNAPLLDQWWQFFLDKGDYYLNLSTSVPTQAFLYLNITPSLANPLNFLNASTPDPIGVVSYGLYNISNTLIPYEIRTDQVQGYANITAISAYNATPPVNVSKYGASLQLNVMLRLKSIAGKTYAYWLQDVMQFNTSQDNYTIGAWIFNATGSGSKVANNTFSGKGIVNTQSIPANWTYYAKVAKITPYSYTQHYTFPLYFTPVIKVEIKNSLPVVMFGYHTNTGSYFYDNVTVNLPSSEAYLLTTPYYRTPINANGVSSQFYDAEFVFAGEGNGESTRFYNLNANIWIYYNDNGTLRAFPSVYTFGRDTAEAATHIAVSRLPTGLALVSIGTNNNTRTIVLNGAPVTTILPTISTTIPTTYSTTTVYNTSIPNATIPSTTIFQNQSNSSAIGSGQQSSGNLTEGFIIIAVVGLIVLWVLYKIYKAVMGKFKKVSKPIKK